MNLEECLEHFRKRTSELKQNKAPEGKILMTHIMAEWLDELLRYRLFLSEYKREIAMTPEKNKAEQIKLLKDEIEDWRLEERVE